MLTELCGEPWARIIRGAAGQKCGAWAELCGEGGLYLAFIKKKKKKNRLMNQMSISQPTLPPVQTVHWCLLYNCFCETEDVS